MWKTENVQWDHFNVFLLFLKMCLHHYMIQTVLLELKERCSVRIPVDGWKSCHQPGCLDDSMRRVPTLGCYVREKHTSLLFKTLNNCWFFRFYSWPTLSNTRGKKQKLRYVWLPGLKKSGNTDNCWQELNEIHVSDELSSIWTCPMIIAPTVIPNTHPKHPQNSQFQFLENTKDMCWLYGKKRAGE